MGLRASNKIVPSPHQCGSACIGQNSCIYEGRATQLPISLGSWSWVSSEPNMGTKHGVWGGPEWSLRRPTHTPNSYLHFFSVLFHPCWLNEPFSQRSSHNTMTSWNILAYPFWQCSIIMKPSQRLKAMLLILTLHRTTILIWSTVPFPKISKTDEVPLSWGAFSLFCGIISHTYPSIYLCSADYHWEQNEKEPWRESQKNAASLMSLAACPLPLRLRLLPHYLFNQSW